MLLYNDVCAAGNLTIEKIIVYTNWCTSMSANHPPPQRVIVMLSINSSIHVIHVYVYYVMFCHMIMYMAM